MRNILRKDSFEHAFELGSSKSVKKMSPAEQSLVIAGVQKKIKLLIFYQTLKHLVTCNAHMISYSDSTDRRVHH